MLQLNNPTDMYLPAVDSDKAIIARLQHVDKLVAGSEAFLQAALLYTTTTGQRRIRVHTLALPITDNISTCFKVSATRRGPYTLDPGAAHHE